MKEVKNIISPILFEVVFNGISQGWVSLSHLTSYKLITSNPTFIMLELFNN